MGWKDDVTAVLVSAPFVPAPLCPLFVSLFSRRVQEIFAPFEDRVFEGESGSSEDKMLLMPNDQIEDLIYFHEVWQRIEAFSWRLLQSCRRVHLDGICFPGVNRSIHTVVVSRFPDGWAT